jgi:hypothetical protein
MLNRIAHADETRPGFSEIHSEAGKSCDSAHAQRIPAPPAP